MRPRCIWCMTSLVETARYMCGDVSFMFFCVLYMFILFAVIIHDCILLVELQLISVTLELKSFWWSQTIDLSSLIFLMSLSYGGAIPSDYQHSWLNAWNMTNMLVLFDLALLCSMKFWWSVPAICPLSFYVFLLCGFWWSCYNSLLWGLMNLPYGGVTLSCSMKSWWGVETIADFYVIFHTVR